MKKHYSQEPVKAEHLYDFLECVLNRNVKDEATAKRVQRLSKYTTTLTDVAVVVEAFMTPYQQYQTHLISRLQVLEIVMQKLGATPEMFKEAAVEYDEQLKKAEAELKAATEQVKAEKEAEATSKVDEIKEETEKNEVVEKEE